jgi:hypothetical protein
VWVSVLVCIAAFAYVGYVTIDAIQGAKIPDEQYGVVASKAEVTDVQSLHYSVTLVDGKVFYIQSNTTLYESINENVSYLFICRIDLPNNRVLLDGVSQVNRTAT